MNIYEALRGVPNKKRLYFQWKFNLNFDQTKKPKNESDFLKMVGNSTLNGFIAWEKSEEYRNLVAILLNTRFDTDLEEIYDSLSVKAKDGDEKSIKLLLQIGKEIKGFAKEAVIGLNQQDDEEDELEI
ncbi:hypothetical protein QYF50_23405 [Paenibacillus vini]|uniref:hypothetical protein n=1 Tax=Paenibacillus vini TaxID=1476024 RepID=UPI0025B717F1|nr:hypothetical protein [Paenibacillus vini]MDN4070856.1 hypothetical protein [Paenibacillus vini]